MDTEPDSDLSNNVYGNIRIGGSASVQLGNSQTTHYHLYNIRPLCHAIRLGRSHASERKLQAFGPRRHPSKSVRARNPRRQVFFRKRRRRGKVQKEHNHNAIVLNKQSENVSTTRYKQIEHLVTYLCARLLDARDVLRSIPSSLVALSSIQDLTAQQSCRDEQCIQGVVANPQTVTAGRDFLVFCAASLSVLLSRNVSMEDMVEFLSKCRQDQLMPLLTFMLGIGLYRYLAMCSFSSMPTTQDFLTLEDAYGRSRTITMDVCVDFRILRHFLEAHYRQMSGKAGEALIKAGQFHLLLGSRRGVVIKDEEWSTPGRIKRGSRIVNSVFLSVNDAKCLYCGNIFVVTQNGEFNWLVASQRCKSSC